MSCKYLTIRTKKGNKYYFCRLLKKEVSHSCYQECDKKEYKQYNQLKSRSNKLAKLERGRYSVFTSDLKRCYICHKRRDDLHEIYGGSNRHNSIKYGFVLPLCRGCHTKTHFTPDFSDFWKKEGQAYWENKIGTREEFIKIFGRNYLD